MRKQTGPQTNGMAIHSQPPEPGAAGSNRARRAITPAPSDNATGPASSESPEDRHTRPPAAIRRGTAISSIALVLLCSLLDGIAQLSLKWGASTVTGWHPQSLLSNPGLWAGYGLYGLSGLLFILALRRGELSVLYPFLGATYVWVVLCSPLLFPADSFSPVKLVGTGLIAVGVSLIGWSAKR